MVGNGFFFVIPVYRLEEDKYYNQLKADHEKSIPHTWSEEFQNEHPAIVQGYKSNHHLRYGGSWEFNEIIGYIKLYFMGSQVRGEYWSTLPKRKSRTRKKQFEYKTHKLYVEKTIWNKTSEGVLSTIEEYLAGCKNELKNRHIDLREFDYIKNHLDWLSLHRERNTITMNK